MLKCVKITSFFFVLLFELLPDTTSTVSGDCDFLRSCVNYKYREKKKKKKKNPEACKFIKKETLAQVLFCGLCEVFKNNVFASDCFSKYESLCMTVAGYSCLVKSCSENIWKISRSISASDCKLR